MYGDSAWQAVPVLRIARKGCELCAAKILRIIKAANFQNNALGQARCAGEHMCATARAKLARDGIGQIISRKSSDSAFGQSKAVL